MVFASSSGRSQPQARLRSRIVTAALDLDRAVGLRLDAARGLDVVLVGDVADDLLDDVLERDQPLQRAIFVDDQREMGAAAQELAHLLVERRRFRDEIGRHRHVHDVEPVERGRARGVPGRSGAPPGVRSLAWITPTMFSGSPRKIGSGYAAS